MVQSDLEADSPAGHQGIACKVRLERLSGSGSGNPGESRVLIPGPKPARQCSALPRSEGPRGQKASEAKGRQRTSDQRKSVANRAISGVSSKPQLELLAEKQKSDSRCLHRKSDRFMLSNGRGRVSCRHHHRRCPCVPGSSPGRIPDDRREAQKALL